MLHKTFCRTRKDSDLASEVLRHATRSCEGSNPTAGPIPRIQPQNGCSYCWRHFETGPNQGPRLYNGASHAGERPELRQWEERWGDALAGLCTTPHSTWLVKLRRDMRNCKVGWRRGLAPWIYAKHPCSQLSIARQSGFDLCIVRKHTEDHTKNIKATLMSVAAFGWQQTEYRLSADSEGTEDFSAPKQSKTSTRKAELSQIGFAIRFRSRIKQSVIWTIIREVLDPYFPLCCRFGIVQQ